MGGLKQRMLLGASMSILMHGLIFALLPGLSLRPTPKPRVLEVRLSARLWSPPAALTPSKPARSQSGLRRGPRPQVARPVTATAPVHAGAEAAIPPVVPEAVPEPSLPELSLAERARAGLQAADRELQAAAQAHPNGQLMALPAPHRNLQSLPPALQTALARSFEHELAELVVLGRSESQQGNERITRIRTNKGTYCVREYLVKPHYLRDVPTVPRVGGCGP